MGECKRSRDPETIEPYLSDESRIEGGRAQEVAWPESAEHATDALREAAAAGTSVTVSGAGTGVAGGRVPRGGLVLATDGMSRILSLRENDPPGSATLVVEAGVTLAEVQRVAADRGWLYPPDPTEPGASIGGTLATNASGPRSYRFGATREWVAAVRGVLADGREFELARRRDAPRGSRLAIPLADGAELSVPEPDWTMPETSKHAAGLFSRPGMDAVDLLIGSEGTLAVLLEAELMLVRMPPAVMSAFIFFGGEARALQFVDAARDPRRPSRVDPWCIELFDAASLDLLRARGRNVPGGARGAVYVEQPIEDDRAERVTAQEWQRLAERAGAGEASWMAGSAADRETFRRMRHDVPAAIGEILARRGVAKIATDTAVPRGRLAGWLDRARRRLERDRIEHVAFGHAGDDHLHVNLLAESEESWPAARRAYHDLVRDAVETGGTVSAEHGIGKLKRESLEMLYGRAVLDRMRGIRDVFDPERRLGRGTMLRDGI